MILKVPEDCCCEVFDANGVPLKWCIWCDTKTGEAVHIALDDGRVEFVTDERGKRSPKTEWRQHPAPLKFTRLAASRMFA